MYLDSSDAKKTTAPKTVASILIHENFKWDVHKSSLLLDFFHHIEVISMNLTIPSAVSLAAPQASSQGCCGDILDTIIDTIKTIWARVLSFIEEVFHFATCRVFSAAALPTPVVDTDRSAPEADRPVLPEAAAPDAQLSATDRPALPEAAAPSVFSGLTDPIALIIVSLLPAKDICALGCVNKHLHNLTRDRTLWTLNQLDDLARKGDAAGVAKTLDAHPDIPINTLRFIARRFMLACVAERSLPVNDLKAKEVSPATKALLHYFVDRLPLAEQSERDAAMKAAVAIDDLKLLLVVLAHGDVSSKECHNAVELAPMETSDILFALLAIRPFGKDTRGRLIAKAVQCHRLDILRTLLKGGFVSEECRGEALVQAVQKGWLDILEVVLASGPISDEAHRTALENAAKAGHAPMIEVLLKFREISFRVRGQLVKVATDSGKSKPVAVLLANGSIPDIDRSCAFKTAVLHEELEIARLLMTIGKMEDADAAYHWEMRVAERMGLEEYMEMEASSRLREGFPAETCLPSPRTGAASHKKRVIPFRIS